ncbi:hypothetical protein Tco_0803171, partial [Tanacetum coccineum]
MARRPLGWKVVEHVSHKKFLNGGVIVVEDDPDVIHVDNSSDLALSTSLNDLEIAALHIDGQSIDVDAPPDIIDVVDEDDDIIDEEDPIPHDLADSDDEDLVNLDIDDGVNVMSADVARGHGGDGGGDDRPPPYQVPTGCGGCLGNRGKGTRKPNLGGRRAGRPHTRQETRNLGLKAITDKSGPVPIRFEVNDRETLMPLGDHAAHWANYLGELVRELPLHYPSWRQMSPERKAGVVAKIGSHYIEKALKEFNYFDFTLVSTLMNTSEKLMPNNGQAVSQLEYSRVIDCLMYVMTCTRPDIASAVGKLSRYTSNHVLEGYTDASWISNSKENLYTSGWVFLLGGAAGKKAEWLRNLILEISLSSKLIAPISICCDSAATLAKAYSQMYNGKSRHL